MAAVPTELSIEQRAPNPGASCDDLLRASRFHPNGALARSTQCRLLADPRPISPPHPTPPAAPSVRPPARPPPYRPYLNYEAHNCIIISRTDLHGFLSRNTAHPSSPPPHACSTLPPLRHSRRGRERSARRASYLDPREPTKRSSVARVHLRT
jgi:hypothetical protein